MRLRVRPEEKNGASTSSARTELGGWYAPCGPMSVRRLAGEPGSNTKPVHREVAMLTATGPIERRAADEVAVGWDRVVTKLDLAA